MIISLGYVLWNLQFLQLLHTLKANIEVYLKPLFLLQLITPTKIMFRQPPQQQ